MLLEVEDEELLELQKELYDYFKDSYDFEKFLKEYLIKMGLDEVELTQRSKDGGIDLLAIRKGVGDFSEIDITHYFIQAKRYNIKNKVNVKTVRELKGIIPFGHKGILITTSDFTKDAIKEAVNDISKPVVLINGKSLVQSCIDNKIGFVFKPIFSRQQLDILVKKYKELPSPKDIGYTEINYIEKIITSNDIRARIISIPSSIMKLLPENKKTMLVRVNNRDEYSVSIVRGRNYLAGVTKILRDYNLLSQDGLITSKNSKWYFDQKIDKLTLIIEN